MANVTVDGDYLKALEGVVEAASDYKLANSNREFAKLRGGAQKLKDDLFKRLERWESLISEMSDVV